MVDYTIIIQKKNGLVDIISMILGVWFYFNRKSTKSSGGGQEDVHRKLSA